jgi:hypothetical protein
MLQIELDDNQLIDGQINGKHFKQIVDSDLKQMIFTHLFETHHIKMCCTNKYFTSIDANNDLMILRKYKHLAYVNTNHPLHLIVLMTLNNRKVCFFLDKQKFSIYLLKCQFEGELIDSNFLISDFLVYMNKNIDRHPFDKRLVLLRSILSPKNYHYDSFLDPFKILVKDFVEYSQLKSFVNDYLPTLPYKNKITGIIFRPNENNNKNIIYNFNNKSIFKPTSIIETNNETLETGQNVQINVEKYKEVKFLLFETGNPDDYCLKLFNADRPMIEYDYALINDMKTSQYFQKILEETPKEVKLKGICVICQYMPNFQKWKPIRVENDQLPNDITKLI